MSSKSFKCEACRGASESLHMRDSDGKWVCAHCIPAGELDACPGLRERLGLKARAPRRKKTFMEELAAISEPSRRAPRRKAA